MAEKLDLARNFEPMIFRDLNRSNFLRWNEFGENKAKGNIRLLKKCADARVHCVLPAENTAHFTSIAAADPLSFQHAYSHPGYSSIIDFTHFADGSGYPPQGCGGFAEWLKLHEGQGGSKNLQGVTSYVWNEIKTADPLLASFQDATAIAHMTDKPVYFGSLDHLTAQLFISGLVVNQSGKIQYFSPVDFNNYNPQRAYSNGFPTINPAQIPNTRWARELEEINRQNAKQQEAIFQANPQFLETQKVQNPGLIFLTDQPHSLRLIFPAIAETPNSDFAVRMLKTKSRGKTVSINPTKAIMQLEYPISHSAASQDKGSGPFMDTKHLLITTENIESSIFVADNISSQGYMKPWIERGGKIMVAGVKKGKIEKASDIALYRP